MTFQQKHRGNFSLRVTTPSLREASARYFSEFPLLKPAGEKKLADTHTHTPTHMEDAASERRSFFPPARESSDVTRYNPVYFHFAIFLIVFVNFISAST